MSIVHRMFFPCLKVVARLTISFHFSALGSKKKVYWSLAYFLVKTHLTLRFAERDVERAHRAQDGDEGLNRVAVDDGLVLFVVFRREAAFVDDPEDRTSAVNRAVSHDTVQRTDHCWAWAAGRMYLVGIHGLKILLQTDPINPKKLFSDTAMVG